MKIINQKWPLPYAKTCLITTLYILSTPSYGQSSPTGTVEVKGTNNSLQEVAKPTVKEEVIENKIFSRPVVEGKAGISLFSEDTYDGRGASQQPINSYARAYLMGNMYFSEDFYLSANIRGTSSSGNNTTGNYFFDDGSAYIAELALRYDADKYSLVAGHTNINYSLARNYAAGLWGAVLARAEYGVDGMMVLGGQYKLDAGSLGNHALSANVFMVDTTALSDTYGATKDPTPLSMGGSANTGKFNNYSFALDGLKIQSLPKFRYQIATVQMQTNSLVNPFTKIAVNPKFLANEQRYAAGIMWDKLDVVSDIKVTPLFEFNRTVNSLGIYGYDKSYYTGSLLFTYKQWNFGFSGSVWDANWSKVNNSNGLLPSGTFLSDRYNQAQAALGYVFKNGIKTTAGYRKENKVNNQNSQTIGLNLSYDLPFAF